MANSPCDLGKESQQKWGWWYAYRFLLLRRISQCSVILMFISGPVWNIWILKGNYSASLFLETIPFSDPLIIMETLATGYIPRYPALLGAGIVALLYSLLASRVFCGWICPVNMITDFAAWGRRKLNIRYSAKLPRHLRYVLVVIILIGSALSGTLLWEWVNPVAAIGRSFVYGLGASIWMAISLFLLDLLVIEHGWCGYICPIGAMYGLIGSQSLIRIKVLEPSKCDRCMDCFHVCPEPQILRAPLLNKNNQSQFVLSQDCISCGRCIDVCSEKVFGFKPYFIRSKK